MLHRKFAKRCLVLAKTDAAGTERILIPCWFMGLRVKGCAVECDATRRQVG